MSARSTWHRPQSAEVLEPHFTFRENVAMVGGFLVVVIFIQLWRLLPK